MFEENVAPSGASVATASFGTEDWRPADRALRSIGARRGLPCERCGQPTHWVDFEIDGCSVCGHAEQRPRKDGRKTAAKLSCATCNPKRTEP